jgi:hypothetical protein
MSDDGVGVRVVQCLASRYVFPAGVTVLDGGTLGDLLPFLEAEHLLIIDAMVTGGPQAPSPAHRRRYSIAFETKLSPHQMGLKDLLAVSFFGEYSRDSSARRQRSFSWDWIFLHPWRHNCKPCGNVPARVGSMGIIPEKSPLPRPVPADFVNRQAPSQLYFLKLS